MDKVGIVLVNWNGWENTIECLESIFHSDYSNYQVIVCDNSSQDNSLVQIKAWADGIIQNDLTKYALLHTSSYVPIPKPIRYVECNKSQAECTRSIVAFDVPLILIQTGANLGFAGGNNVGICYALNSGADYIWLLNNDTVITPMALSKMVETIRRFPGIVGSIIKYYSRPDKVQAYGGGHMSCLTGRVRTQIQQTSSLDFILGASLMLDRATLRQVGLLDENLFMYFEENEYCLRARKHGVTLTVSESEVYHKGGASSPNSHFAWNNVYKNKIYTMLKHCGIGFWIPSTLLMWAINILNPKNSIEKRRASREACFRLLDAVAQVLKGY